jgi:hypothetical protein
LKASTSYIKIIFLLLGILYTTITIAQSPKLTFSDLNLGVDACFTSNQDSIISARYYNQAFGVSGKYQTSVVANYVNKGKDKRFQIVDIVGGELTGGLFKSDSPFKKEPFWFAFRFDLGMGCMYRINEHQQIGLNWYMMRFANDFISDYIGGAELQLRYRFQRMSLELGTINRNVRVGGVFENYIKDTKDENMYSLGVRYLLNEKRNVGLRVENFNWQAEGAKDQILNVRLYYGLYY